MARKLRVEYPGAIYHVMNRGDRHEPIFGQRGGSPAFRRDARRGLRQDGLAASRLCPHAEPFSSGGRDTPAQSGRRDEMVAGHLHQPLQPAAQAVRTPFLRPLQVADRRWFGRWLPQTRVRLRASESGACGTDGGGPAVAKFCLEQLAGVFAGVVEAPGGGCGWTGCWASGASPRTARRVGNSWSGRWKRGAGRRRAGSSRRSGAAGVWARRRYGRSCWRR